MLPSRAMIKSVPATAGAAGRVAAAEDVAERHVELPVVKLRNRCDRQFPIIRTADVVEPNTWIADHGTCIGPTRFNDQNPGAGL